MVKSNLVKSLRKKRDISKLKKKGRSFVYNWMRVTYSKCQEPFLLTAFSIPKKYIPRAVDRNRLRRWARENLKQSFQKKGLVLITLLPKEKGFYRDLKRKDFDDVFKSIMEKSYKEAT